MARWLLGNWDIPARAYFAQSPEPPKTNSLLGDMLLKAHGLIDPVNSFGGYGGLLGMALPMGSAPKAALPELPLRAYHGTKADFATFDLNRAKPFEPGVFFSPDPETASLYAGYSDSPWVSQSQFKGAKVVPVDIDLKNAAIVDYRKLNSGKTTNYGPAKVRDAIMLARKKGKDFVILRGLEDTGGTHDQIVALNPKGRVRNALTGETMFGGAGVVGLSSILADALARNDQ